MNCGNRDGDEESSNVPLARSKGAGPNRVSTTSSLTRIRSDYEYRNAAKTINNRFANAASNIGTQPDRRREESLVPEIADRLTIAQHKSTLKISSLETECVMIAKYDIFKLRSDGSFVRVEAVEDILAAKQRLDILSVKEPGDYHLWDSSSHKFVNPFAKSASS